MPKINSSQEFDREMEFSEKYLSKGKISDLLRFKLDEALGLYRIVLNNLDRLNSDGSLEFDFNLEQALVKDAYIVGGLLWGRSESDVDLYLQTYGTNYQTDRAIKLMHFENYKNKPKQEWVDLYLGRGLPSQDNFLGKPNYRITAI